VLSSGFSESGPRGSYLERQIIEIARRYKMRVLGPNCLGLVRPSIGLNATFAHASAIKGSIGLVSQSGALCAAVLDWAKPNGVGFSAVVSLGVSADIDFGDVLDFLATDHRTESIILVHRGHPQRAPLHERAAAPPPGSNPSWCSRPGVDRK